MCNNVIWYDEQYYYYFYYYFATNIIVIITLRYKSIQQGDLNGKQLASIYHQFKIYFWGIMYVVGDTRRDPKPSLFHNNNFVLN